MTMGFAALLQPVNRGVTHRRLLRGYHQRKVAHSQSRVRDLSQMSNDVDQRAMSAWTSATRRPEG